MPAEQLRLLVVCTANQCRSPMAEVLARRIITRRAINATIESAGTHTIDGAPATDGAQTTMRKLGLALDGHVSRSVTPELTDRADLVLVMERHHLIELVVDGGCMLSATYTVPELARLASGALRERDEPFPHWLDRISHGRDATTVLGAPEIADPIGQSLRRYLNTARTLSENLETIFDSLSAPRRSP